MYNLVLVGLQYVRVGKRHMRFLHLCGVVKSEDILFQRENQIMQKKSYTQEFKREAVRLAQTSGKSIAGGGEVGSDEGELGSGFKKR